MKKTITIALLTLLTMALFAGCASPAPAPGSADKKVPVQDIFDKIRTDVESPKGMMLDDAMLSETYGLDAAALDSFAVELPMMNVKANELAILKAKDADGLKAITDACEKRAEVIKQNFGTYLPDQAEIANQYVVKTVGNYVLFVIDDNADAIVKIFDEMLK